jgi:hypothetical protein
MSRVSVALGERRGRLQFLADLALAQLRPPKLKERNLGLVLGVCERGEWARVPS